MALDEINSTIGEMLEKHTEPNCHFFLWTTNHFLPDAIDLVKQWGLQYCLAFTWEKLSKNGKPVGMKVFDLPTQNSEFVVYARKGTPPKFADTKGFYTAFQALRRGHSVKPSEF